MIEQNITTVINFEYLFIFQIYTYINFSFSMIFLLFYAYIIYICFDHQMKTFRLLQYCNLSAMFLILFVILLWQPIRLFRFDIIYSAGPAAKFSSFWLPFFFVFLNAFHVDTFIFQFVERHFQIIKVFKTGIERIRKSIYFILIFSMALLNIAVAIFLLCMEDDKNAYKILDENLPPSDAKKIILFGCSAFLKLHLIDSYTGIMALFFQAIYVIVRIILMLWLIYQNFMFSKTVDIKLSENSKKRFKLMLQTTIIQTFVFASFGSLLAATIFLMIHSKDTLTGGDYNFPLIYLCLLCATILYPIFFCFTAIFWIKTFRTAAFRILFYQPFWKRQISQLI